MAVGEGAKTVHLGMVDTYGLSSHEWERLAAISKLVGHHEGP